MDTVHFIRPKANWSYMLPRAQSRTVMLVMTESLSRLWVNCSEWSTCVLGGGRTTKPS